VYKYTHNQEIATNSTAQMLSNMLYAKRFFPYYVSNVLVSCMLAQKRIYVGYQPTYSLAGFDP
jgi:20S proteasome subunit beta 6